MAKETPEHTARSKHIDEMIAEIPFIYSCVRKLNLGTSVPEKDLNEIALRLKLESEAERWSRIKAKLLSLFPGLSLQSSGSNISAQASTASSTLKLKCLSSLCLYDSSNGTTYAFSWSSLLSQLIKFVEDSEEGKSIETSVYWSLYNEIGSTMLFNRRPKHFSDGLPLQNIEFMLTLERGVALLSSPIAIYLSARPDNPYAPNFIYTSELLRELTIKKIKLYSSEFNSADSMLLERDLYSWFYNSSLKGRSGRNLISDCDESRNYGPLSIDRILFCLEKYDNICATRWADYAVKFFAYLKNYCR